jgi:predicted transcriptional regulator
MGTGNQLRRTKLETYIDILFVLTQKGPLKLTHITYEANVNSSILKEHLSFLIKQDLVEEYTTEKKRDAFSITPNGITVLKYFREVKQVLPKLASDQPLFPNKQS